jgi:hypothetical protein
MRGARDRDIAGDSMKSIPYLLPSFMVPLYLDLQRDTLAKRPTTPQI